MKVLLGLFLLPFCFAQSKVFADLLVAIRPDHVHQLPPGAIAFIVGFGLWAVMFLALPRPVRTYVLGHELTHALWALGMGGRVGKLKVSSRGGSVMLSKTNILITLAPYFFPLYTVAVILLHGILSLFIDPSVYEVFWLALVGLTWSFHVTFTISMLSRRQTDIQPYGRLLGYSFIYLLNLAGACLWMVAVGAPTVDDWVHGTVVETHRAWEWIWRGGVAGWGAVSGWIGGAR